MWNSQSARVDIERLVKWWKAKIITAGQHQNRKNLHLVHFFISSSPLSKFLSYHCILNNFSQWYVRCILWKFYIWFDLVEKCLWSPKGPKHDDVLDTYRMIIDGMANLQSQHIAFKLAILHNYIANDNFCLVIWALLYLNTSAAQWYSHYYNFSSVPFFY